MSAYDALGYSRPFNEEGVYQFRCDDGHENIVLFGDKAKFELLAETATQAIVDGYFREAITSFAAALERFFEFYIQVIAASRSIPAVEFKRAWSQTPYSERQIGMYVGFYLLENNAPPPPLPGTLSKRRNDVVHAGGIPTEAEAHLFGQDVLDHIIPVLLNLRERYVPALEQLRNERHEKAFEKLRETANGSAQFSWYSNQMIIDWLTESGAAGRTLKANIVVRRQRAEARSARHLDLIRKALSDEDSSRL